MVVEIDGLLLDLRTFMLGAISKVGLQMPSHSVFKQEALPRGFLGVLRNSGLLRKRTWSGATRLADERDVGRSLEGSRGLTGIGLAGALEDGGLLHLIRFVDVRKRRRLNFGLIGMAVGNRLHRLDEQLLALAVLQLDVVHAALLEVVDLVPLDLIVVQYLVNCKHRRLLRPHPPLQHTRIVTL